MGYAVTGRNAQGRSKAPIVFSPRFVQVAARAAALAVREGRNAAGARKFRRDVGCAKERALARAVRTRSAVRSSAWARLARARLSLAALGGSPRDRCDDRSPTLRAARCNAQIAPIGLRRRSG